MKRIITSAFIIMLTIGAANAQTKSTENHQGHKKEQKMSGDKINLTEDQKARLQVIREDYKKQSEALKNNTTLSDEQKKTRRRELHENFKKQSEAILTPEQRDAQAKRKEQFKSMRKDRKGKFSKEGKPGAGNGHVKSKGMERGKEMKQELGLTEDQQNKLAAIRASFKPKFEALRNDNTLTEGQKREKMKALMQQQQTQMKAILTTEQIQKMEAQKGQYSKRKNK